MVCVYYSTQDHVFGLHIYKCHISHPLFLRPHMPRSSSHAYVCYVIANRAGTRTYAGCTNNLVRRMRQHDGELKGGAKATRGGGPWRLLFVVRGFGDDQRAALRLEWRLKQHRNWQRKLTAPPLVRRQLLLERALAWAATHLVCSLEVVYGLPDGVTGASL